MTNRGCRSLNLIDQRPEHQIAELDRSGLRQFGLVTGGMFAGLFGVVFPLVLDFTYPVWPWIILGVLGGVALTVPSALGPVYYWWMRLALLISKVTTPLVLGIVFFVIVSPMGVIMRVFRWDPLFRRRDEESETFRRVSTQAPVKNLEKPY